MNDFAGWLNAEMKKRGWDKYDLSVESDLSIQAIYSFMAGKQLPSYQSLKMILKAFNMHIEFVND